MIPGWLSTAAERAGRLADLLVDWRWPLAPQVQYGVAGAVDEQEQREVDELIEFFEPIPGCVQRDLRCPTPCTSCARVSAAGVAAETSPEAVSTTPRVPASGHPDPVDQAHAVRLLIEEHYITSVSCDTVCFCGQWRGHHAAHADHVADVVCNMLAADARMAAATNKFRQ